MSLRTWIQEWLGIAGLHRNVAYQSAFMKGELSRLTDGLQVHNLALGRIIAKLDPLFGVPEDDPARKAASNKLSNDIIAKLKAEQSVRDYYGYTPPKDAS